ncbi:hypothetical protein F442_05821 [Phytophthora nicotianae P10297]|uniref:Uncharacterized protein n=1 Tax=Phytophthora nicotianae P10297 TaxID=1317064 RepID=W2ZMC1_PHYNI|nr:hypothetical protein F442_05821 [Phytophthora nicotianae P10297]
MSIYSDFCAIFADDGVITWRVVVDDESQDWIEVLMHTQRAKPLT